MVRKCVQTRERPPSKSNNSYKHQCHYISVHAFIYLFILYFIYLLFYVYDKYSLMGAEELALQLAADRHVYLFIIIISTYIYIFSFSFSFSFMGIVPKETEDKGKVVTIGDNQKNIKSGMY